MSLVFAAAPSDSMIFIDRRGRPVVREGLLCPYLSIASH